MTRRRIRYSELATPSPAPAREPTPIEIARALAEAPAVRAPSAVDDVPVPARHATDDVSPAPDIPPVGVEPPRADHVVDFLVFRIGVERYAAELARIAEVIDLTRIHYVPEMPPAMLGVMSVRGAFVRVYSPGAVLNVSLSDRRAVLIVRQGGRQVGILVDDVEDALAVDLRTIAPPHAGGASDAVVAGILQHGQSLVSLVDADALVAACRSALLAEVS